MSRVRGLSVYIAPRRGLRFVFDTLLDSTESTLLLSCFRVKLVQVTSHRRMLITSVPEQLFPRSLKTNPLTERRVGMFLVCHDALYGSTPSPGSEPPATPGHFRSTFSRLVHVEQGYVCKQWYHLASSLCGVCAPHLTSYRTRRYARAQSHWAIGSHSVRLLCGKNGIHVFVEPAQARRCTPRAAWHRCTLGPVALSATLVWQGRHRSVAMINFLCVK